MKNIFDSHSQKTSSLEFNPANEAIKAASSIIRALYTSNIFDSNNEINRSIDEYQSTLNVIELKNFQRDSFKRVLFENEEKSFLSKYSALLKRILSAEVEHYENSLDRQRKLIEKQKKLLLELIEKSNDNIIKKVKRLIRSKRVTYSYHQQKDKRKVLRSQKHKILKNFDKEDDSKLQLKYYELKDFNKNMLSLNGKNNYKVNRTC